MKTSIPKTAKVNRTFWQGKKVLLTGHTGFKGAWLSLWLQSLGVNLIGFSLAPPTTPSLFEITQLSKGMTSILANIEDFSALLHTIKKYQPEIVIHMAAQSLVRFSYEEPLKTYATNVMGTVNLLEAIRISDSVKIVVNVTSDKCYENNKMTHGYCEADRLGGYDPYSNSKACSELVTQAYKDSYFKNKGIGIATARAGNVIGGGDWAKDRLIPDVINACINNKPVLLRYPNALRPWQHVLQALQGYLLLAERLYLSPDVYAENWNFGPNRENIKSVSWVTDYLIKMCNNQIRWVKDERKYPFEASILQLDCTKAKKRLNWNPIWNLEIELEKTVAWFQANQAGENMYDKTISQINQFSDEVQEIEKNFVKETLNV